MPSVPSVTMNGGMFAFVIRNPLSVPQAPPATIATTRPTRMTPQSLPPIEFMTFADTTPENTSTAPTERSMPAVMMM